MKPELKIALKLKVYNQEIIKNFFGLNKKITLVSFRKKSILFLRLLPGFRCSNIFVVTEHTRNQFFCELSRIFLNFHFGPIRWVRWVPGTRVAGL